MAGTYSAKATDSNGRINSVTPVALIDSSAVSVLSSEYDFTSVAQTTFIGNAVPGTALSAAAWQIYKLSYDTLGNLTAKQWANGSGSYTNIWNNRASLPYS